jgi:hypothetical protein
MIFNNDYSRRFIVISICFDLFESFMKQISYFKDIKYIKSEDILI